MKKLIFSSLFMLLGLTSVSAQSALQNEILEVANRTNNYFMTKYSDPTLDTFVKKSRTSNLWTRAVYYEGLMALYEIDPQQRYLDYTDKWADYHKWTARGSVKDTDADNQCCQQTYIDRYVQTGGKKDLSKVKENLDHQMGTNRVNYWTWIDAIQMAMPAYAKYAKITGERKYLDYAMNSYKWSRDTLANGLFNKKEGLWWRDKDYVPPYKEKDGSNCYWSRGNGWVYAALVRVMETLPKYTDNNFYEVGTVTATYTKVLPKAFPADITFRPGQETGKGTGYFIAYMTPENGYTVTNKSVYGSVDLNNVFYNLDDNVSFEIADAAKDANDKLTSVRADKANNFVAKVAAKDFINSTTKHAVTAKYNYGEISLVKNNKTGQWEKKPCSVDYGKSLSVTFACWHSASSYDWKEPALQWKATANVIKTDIKNIAVENTYNNDFFGGTFAQLLTNKYLEVKAGSAHLTYEGQVDPYFTVEVDATNGQFIFTQTGIQAENAPTVDHTENLEFVVVDAYGHEVPQSFKVTIKRPASK